jgi:hypothetical protein
MLEIILVLLVILWFLGYIHLGINIPDIRLLVINGHAITLVNLLIFLLILWAIGILPSPFRQIAGVLVVLWVLSILGFIAIAGLSNLLVIAIIVGIVASLFMRK